MNKCSSSYRLDAQTPSGFRHLVTGYSRKGGLNRKNQGSYCASSSSEKDLKFRDVVEDGHGSFKMATADLMDRILPGSPFSSNEILGGKLPCPSTVWDVDGISLENRTDPTSLTYDFPLTLTPEELGFDGSFSSHKEQLLKQVEKHGAVLLRGFPETGTPAGMKNMYNALGLEPCEDPLSKTGLRKSVDNQLYETVNNLPNHYVGMHAELTPLLAPRHAAFVCFTPADQGGEFLLLDGRRMWATLDPMVLQRMLDNQISFKVAGFDFSFMKDAGEGFRKPLMWVFESLFLGLTKSKFDLTCNWKEVDGKLLLEALEPAQSAVTRHPDTKEITYVCNIHNHSRYLRNNRPCDVPEVAMTETYYGDKSPIPLEDVKHINQVTEECMVRLKMQPGDVVLLDNYLVLHGRDIFKNIETERMHSVVWFAN
eukprot:CAMPEP_0196592330 /NCGR_PEP_ID=MMETSP1081-20130531/72445_1 /TAXON_ID=36882 /ORGANISM="Pyramimonas amylifera, Strain CCMP720" /LENGTH=424 /DNA_ID=CAMNT_0041915979 /DNA_START=116 /DNA_END=1390 /DNA_ORIENTATION=-